MIHRLVHKLRKKEPKIEKKAKHINEFRTQNCRVFYAQPYFNLDLWFEIDWHKKHIKKLKKHAEKPHLFHRQFTSGKITEDRHRHFKEHVLDSMPFHEKMLSEHEIRLKTILKIIPTKIYKKIMKISRKYDGTPEYFVYDKLNKEYFFVAERLNKKREKWINLVRDKHKFCDVVILK